MQIIISDKSSAPIYEQITKQIKEGILNHALAPDEMLPSIRQLAKELQISVITTKRAYEELENEGLIYSVPQKGFFVSPSKVEILREKRLKLIEDTAAQQQTVSFQLKCATYGHTGNGIDNAGYFSYLKRYNEDGGFWYSNGTSMSNGGSVSEISPLANTLLTWEKGRKVNVGLDLTLLKNRLTFSADYYNDYYYDILQSRGKSIQLLGIAYPAENIGKTRYYGLETQLSWQDHIGKVNYYVSANWSMEQNKRLFMDEQYVPYDYLRATGQPTGAIYGLVATGFLTAKDIADGYPVMNGFNNIQAGDVKYKDMNGDGEINEFDRTVIGGDKPTCYFGIDLGFEWKGLEVTALIQGAYNRDLYNSDRTLLEGFQVIGQSYGQAYTNLLNRWTPETAETATYPRLTAGGNMYNYGNNWNSSLFVQNGNYIRLKNATVSYKLPENFCRNYLGGLRVKIFIQGQNLLTWSRTRLQDPEVTFTSYPLQRTITTGINLNF